MIYLILSAITILMAFNIFIIYSMKRLIRSGKNETDLVNISVIIALKNEEHNLEGLFSSLKDLYYPLDKYEVILVDDNSVDGTLKKMKNIAESFVNVFIFDLRQTKMSGKRDALSLGIQNSHHQFLVITDADCRPEKNWLKSYSEKIGLGYDMLIGIAPFFQRKNFVNKLSCFENLRGSVLSLSLANSGLPYSAAARNLGFSRKAFEILEGYSRTKDTISGDDDLLLREAVRSKLIIGTVIEPGSYVFSETKSTLKDYFKQKARHTQTSFHYLIQQKIILGIWHLLNLLFLMSPLFIFFDLHWGILLPAKLIMDFVIALLFQKKFHYEFSVIEIFYLQFVYEFFLIVHFFNARFSNIKWK